MWPALVITKPSSQNITVTFRGRSYHIIISYIYVYQFLFAHNVWSYYQCLYIFYSQLHSYFTGTHEKIIIAAGSVFKDFMVNLTEYDDVSKIVINRMELIGAEVGNSDVATFTKVANNLCT